MLKKICIAIVCSIITAFVVNRLFEVYVRADSLFFRTCLDYSDKWAEELRKTEGPCYVFAGGSEVRMSITPVVMYSDYGVKVINAATQLGTGMRCNVQLAMEFLEEGDTLILSWPTGITNLKDDGISSSGINLCASRCKWETLRDGILPWNKNSILALLNGTFDVYWTNIKNIVKGRRYPYACPDVATIGKDGRVNVYALWWQEKALKEPLPPPVEQFEKKELQLIGWQKLLEDIQKELKKKNNRLIANISLLYGNSPAQKYENVQVALYLTKMGIPVIKDPHLGVCSDPYVFSDSARHMSVERGRRYSSLLAKLLKEEQFWTEEELEDILKSF